MEIEVKLKLKEEDYEKLLNVVKEKYPFKIVNQTNVFYDTPTNDLSKIKRYFRIRLENEENDESSSKAEFCSKGPSDKKDGVVSRIEQEEYIDFIMAKNIVSGISSISDLELELFACLCDEFQVSQNELIEFGRFENKRVKAFVPSIGTLEIDKTTYSSPINTEKMKINYELELEIPNSSEIDRFRDALINFLNENHITFQYSKHGKFKGLKKFLADL
eukprot:TRINITY_DN10075_c0_g1_i1.p1 TRINITY_DN10075_c0_g1~~TRINITY_DN10075_c0_g1_i1.p1  ORF type:complete len:234 (-),score=73.29 TRINITY_DN10075_c0_g1_i1:157-810(-)